MALCLGKGNIKLTDSTVPDDTGDLLLACPRRIPRGVTHTRVQAALGLPLVGPRGREVGEDVVDGDEAAAGREVLVWRSVLMLM